jgi:hypothetical protein
MHCRSISRFEEREARHEIVAPIHCSALQEIAFHFAFVWHFLLIAASCWAQDQHSTGWVVIPVAEYRTLRSRAYPVEPEPESPVVQATLTRIDYDLRINGELATGHSQPQRRRP